MTIEEWMSMKSGWPLLYDVHPFSICRACLKTGYPKNMRNGATANRLPIIFPRTARLNECFWMSHWISPLDKPYTQIKANNSANAASAAQSSANSSWGIKPHRQPHGQHRNHHISSPLGDHHPLMTPSFRVLWVLKQKRQVPSNECLSYLKIFAGRETYSDHVFYVYI